jgi:lipoprotein NlpD
VISPISKHALLCAITAAIAAGCSVKTGAPVIDRTQESKAAAAKPVAAAKPAPRPADARPEFHTVRKGDTLYSIALDYGVDYRELAQWNGLTELSVISIGQPLRLSPAPGAAAATAPLKAETGVQARALDETPTAVEDGGVKTQPKAVRAPYSDQAYAQLAGVKPEPAPKTDSKPQAASYDGVQWGWPTSGKVVNTFNGTTIKGIGIAGKPGQPVVASAAGRVIFSGTATGTLGRLGKFIVVKHNETFNSVYAHNNELYAKYGQTVAKGQKIAEMGSTDSNQVMLYFEIRRLGIPVDPIKFLPPT